MNHLDWCPWYLAQWQGSSVKLLSLAAQGAYMQILLLQFSEGSVPADVKSLAKLIGQDSTDLAAVWDEISEKFVESEPGRLVNVPMAEIRLAQMSKHETATAKASAAAKARWEAAQLKADREAKLAEQNAEAMLQASQKDASSITTEMLQASSEDAPSIAPSNAQAMPLDKNREEEIREDFIKLEVEGMQGEKETPVEPPAKAVPWEKALFDLLPVSHRTEALKDALRAYGQLRRSKNWGTLAEVTVRAKAKSWGSFAADDVVAALIMSTEQGWQSVNIKPTASTAQALGDQKSDILKLLEGEGEAP